MQKKITKTARELKTIEEPYTRPIYIEKGDEGEIEESVIEDVYEVFSTGIKVHSRPETFNEDWTLSDLTPGERYFVKEQIRVVELIKNYIQDPLARKRLAKNMLIDIHSTLTLSRAKQGRMIKGTVEFMVGQKKAQEIEEEEKEQRGWFANLFSRSKK